MNFNDLWTFPPFFTLQPNLDTRQKQLKLWKDFILDSSAKNKLWFMTDKDAIFTNANINRKCSQEFINLIIQELIKTGSILHLLECRWSGI